MSKIVVVEHLGKAGLSSSARNWLMAFFVSMMASPAFADGIDVASEVSSMKTQGLAAIGAVIMALIAMAALAVVGKWAKAAFFS